MKSYCWSRGQNAYVAGETHNLCWEKFAKQASGVIYCPGSHSNADTTKNVEQADVQLLASSGDLAVCIGDTGQPTTSQGQFGSTLSQTRIGQIKTYLQGASVALSIGINSGEVALVGGSGGATAAINYARANPSEVGAIVGICPVVDLQDFYENRTDGSLTQAEIQVAYGGVPTYSTHNPSASGNQTALAGIPIRLYYSTDDPYVPTSTVTTFQSLVQAAGGTCELRSLGAVGHSDTGLSYESLSSDDLADFLKSYV